jgi:hypothetical protein
MDESGSSRRRWSSHEWNVLLVIGIITALPLGWLGWQASIVQYRRSMRKQIEANGGRVVRSTDAGISGATVMIRNAATDRSIPKIRRLLGDDGEVQFIVLGNRPTAADLEAAKAFPEAWVYKPR